jgi:hypothetical protein
MGRSSKALTALTSNLLDGFSGKLTTEMEHVVLEIDKLLTDHQAAGMQTYWLVGKLITDVEQSPDVYLTPEQQSANIDAGNLLLHLFEQIYTADQLRTTQRFYQMYPEREDLQALLGLRCPDRPLWRMTVSHVQVLTTIPDQDQRQALTNQCAEEAYTARALAMEVQEIRGNKRPGAGRTHAAPKGLKQQVQDVLEFQKRFIARSEKLWLEDNGVYDAIVNSPPQKRSEAIHNFLQEIRENFDKMQDLISTHIALCEKAQAAICEDEDSDVEPVSRKVAGSKMTRHK